MRRAPTCAAVLLVAAMLALTGPSGADPVFVDLPKLGRVEGVRLAESRYFKGIPYAAPPVGDLRWRPPQPRDPWAGVWDATDYSPSCMQGPGFDEPITNKSEDCLYLNVFTPDEAPKTPFAVMVWFHGGAYSVGGSNVTRLNGTWFVNRFRDVVVVTLNYRLNIFGFLASDELRKRSPDGSAGNFGIQDQRAALQWVQLYISRFGGDPNNVMIFGESAGAGSVSNHLVTPKSFDLYHKAVMQSGSFSYWIAKEWDSAVDTYNKALQLAECSDLDCLVGMPADQLIESISGLSWAPVVDGVDLLAHPDTLLRNKAAKAVPIIVGANRDEGTMFHNLPHDLTEEGYDAFLYENFGNAAPIVKSVYSPQKYPATPCCSSQYWAANHVVGDVAITCASHRTAKLVSDQNAWHYLFNHAPKIPADNEFAYHACEIPYVFNVGVLLDGPDGDALSLNVATYWRNFAVSGNPNSEAVPEWPAYSNSTSLSIYLDLEITVKARDRSTECSLWNTALGSNTTFHLKQA